jgi:hypothetical protein
MEIIDVKAPGGLERWVHVWKAEMEAERQRRGPLKRYACKPYDPAIPIVQQLEVGHALEATRLKNFCIADAKADDSAEERLEVSVQPVQAQGPFPVPPYSDVDLFDVTVSGEGAFGVLKDGATWDVFDGIYTRENLSAADVDKVFSVLKQIAPRRAPQRHSLRHHQPAAMVAAAAPVSMPVTKYDARAAL